MPNRWQPATVVWTKSNNRNTTTTSIAFIGGSVEGRGTLSVYVLNDVFNGLPKCQWQNGPHLNECRSAMGASICNGYVYVMGGQTFLNFYTMNFSSISDTIERISVSKLFHYDQNHENKKATWKRLRARLSEPRRECTAVTVNNRFIVVMGGWTGGWTRYTAISSSVDIIDTMTRVANNFFSRCLTNDEHQTVVTVTPGPSLQIPRFWFTATVVDDRIWVVGGEHHHGAIPKAAECLRYGTNNDTSQSIFSSAWDLWPDLSLPRSRHAHGVLAVEDCLVVAGGSEDFVALLDPQRGAVLELPEILGSQMETTMVQIPYHGLATIGLYDDGTVRMNSLPFVALSLMKLKKYLKEHECRQPSYIPRSLRHTSEEPPETAPEVPPLRATVECLCHSLVYYYLFHKGGHVPCVQHQQDMQ